MQGFHSKRMLVSGPAGTGKTMLAMDQCRKLKAEEYKAFKGLEARVILYIDIEGFEEDDERLLNYVAMSRARTLLEVFYKADLEEERQRMMLNSYNL